MASGVATNPQCVAEFNNMKLSKKMSYIIFKMNDKMTEIMVDQIGYKDEKNFDDFVALMDTAARVDKQARYAVVDTQDSKHKDVLVFICWISDDHCALKQKMLYTSSKSAFKKAALSGVGKDWQVNSLSELTKEGLMEVVEKGSTK